jgi:hypothetical protein
MFDVALAASAHFYIRTTVACLCAGAALKVAYRTLLQRPEHTGSLPVGNVVAFNAASCIVIGMAAVVAAADRWPVAMLWSGAALFAGVFLGILFGVPYTATTVAAKRTAKHRPPSNAPALAHATAAATPGPPPLVREDPGAPAHEENPPPPPKSQTLLIEAASWFSKFLAGATFAQAKNLMVLFVRISRAVGAYIVVAGPNDHVAAVGGGLLLYFGLCGFLAGLILPSYFVLNL